MRVMNDHSFEMIQDYFEINISDKLITPELIKLVSEKGQFKSKITESNFDKKLDELHYYLIGMCDHP